MGLELEYACDCSSCDCLTDALSELAPSPPLLPPPSPPWPRTSEEEPPCEDKKSSKKCKKVLKKGKCDSNTKCDLTCGHCTVTPPPPPPLCSNEKSKKFCTKQAKKSNCGQKKAIKKCAL